MSRHRTKLSPALLLLVAIFALGACNRRPGIVLDDERMARLLVDLELADAFTTDQRLSAYVADSARLDLRRSVLAKHGVNEARLDSSFRWYGEHLPDYVKVIERADSILADSLRALENEERIALTKAAGDSTDVWPLAPSLLFARNMPSDIVSFEIPADSSWKRGDVLTLTFALHNAQSRVDATMAVDYANKNRTTDAIYGVVYPGDDARLEMKLQIDSLLSMKRVYGYLQLKPAEGERAFVDSIRLVRTRVVNDDYNRLRRIQRRLRRLNH